MKRRCFKEREEKRMKVTIKGNTEELRAFIKKEPRGNGAPSLKLGDSEIIQFKDHILVCSNRLVVFDQNDNPRIALATQQK